MPPGLGHLRCLIKKNNDSVRAERKIHHAGLTGVLPWQREGNICSRGIPTKKDVLWIESVIFNQPGVRSTGFINYSFIAQLWGLRNSE
jgi:hypothetical protein